LWSYAIDDRPWQGPAPPAVVYIFAEDRKGQHVHEHLTGFSGVLQVDGYAGYGELTRPNRPGGAITLAFCLAHARRQFFEIYQSSESSVAAEALRRIGAVYEIEARIRGLTAAERVAVRQAETQPILEAFKAWLMQQLEQESSKSKLAGAIRYTLGHWHGLMVFLTDGRVEVDTNVVERTMRAIAMRRSLCSLSSSVWKHWQLIFARKAMWTPFSSGRGNHPIILQIGGADLIRCPGHDLLGGEDSVLDESADHMVIDAESGHSLGRGEPLAILFRGTISVDPVNPPQRADTVGGPGFPVAGAHSHSVQRCSDVLIGPSACHVAYHRERLFGRAAAMLTGFRFLRPQLRMLTTAPVYRQDNLSRRLVNICNYVSDQGPYKPLPCAHARSWRIPGCGEVRGKVGEVWCLGRQIGRVSRLQPRPTLLHAPEGCLPVLLQLSSYQAIIWIAGSVAPLRECGFVSGLLQFQLDDVASFVLAFHVHPLGFHRRLDRHRPALSRQGRRDLCDRARHQRVDDRDWPPPTVATGQRVAYHSACSLQHGQRVRLEPRNCLRRRGSRSSTSPSHISAAAPPAPTICCSRDSPAAGEHRERDAANPSPQVISAASRSSVGNNDAGGAYCGTA
jgi:hypothetical protein